MNKLLDASISSNTKTSYETGLRSFFNFRREFGYEILWPPPLRDVVQFVSYLSLKKCSYATARSYLSSISFQCKVQNLVDETKNFLVLKVLEGMRRIGRSADARLPITLELLKQLVETLPGICHDTYETKLFRAAYLLAFFGFLRIGEFALSTGNGVHSILQVTDVQFQANYSKLLVLIKSSKTDQDRKGVSLVIDRIEGILCPVAGLIDYLAVRPKIKGPLFIHLGKNPLTRYQFSAILEKALHVLGVEGHYRAHSFRIGAATLAFEAGCTQDLIMEAGRWKSRAYRTYIRCPIGQMLGTNKM